MSKPENTVRKPDPDIARRALEEAQSRRDALEKQVREEEVLGKKGPEPTRYGDWENKGIASDF